MAFRLKKAKLLGRTFQRCYHITCRVLCFVLLFTQAAILNYYLIYFHKSMTMAWHMWMLADLGMVLIFCAAFVVSYNRLKTRPLVTNDPQPTEVTDEAAKTWRFAIQRCASELHLSWIAWLSHSVLLSAKVCVLYALPDSIALQLNEVNFFGPNTLKTAISISCVINYLLVVIHHDFRTKSGQNEFIQSIVGSVCVDILDTTQFLGVLVEESKVITAGNMDKVMLAAATLNYILPTVGIFVLARCSFGLYPLSTGSQLIFKVIYYLIVNVPMFVIRMIVWHLHSQDISVFVVKNVVAVGVSFKDVHEFFLEVTEVIVPEPGTFRSHRRKNDDDIELKNSAVGLVTDKDSSSNMI